VKLSVPKRRGPLSVLAVLAVAALPAAAQEPLVSELVSYSRDTGEVWNDTDVPAVVISFPVLLSEAAWLRLYFEEIRLGEGVLRITSYASGDAHELRARQCVEWRNSSCYLDGNCVQVEVETPPHSGPYRLVLSHVDAGRRPPSEESQCGPTDNRVLSNDPRVCRVVPVGCTGFLIDDGNRGLLSAGRCVVPGRFECVWFNVPASDPSGAPRVPSPDDQYPIDPESIQQGGGGVGDGWVYFGVFANSNTGISAGHAQGACFDLGAPPAVAEGWVGVTGHGRDSTPPTHNAVQQAHVGALVAASATTLEHEADTDRGSAGSPIVWRPTGRAIGVHTHDGCDTGGANSGTASTTPGLGAALASPQGVCREPKLLARDGAAGDVFGSSVSVSGDTLVVAARGDDDAAENSGAAYVFVRDGSTWTLEAKLKANDAEEDDSFGDVVCVSGDTVAVGAAGSDGSGLSSGSAYVFVRDGTTWVQQAKLIPSDGTAYDHFGRAVSANGDTVVVGAPGNDENGSFAGAAFVFVRDGTTWRQQAKLLADDAKPGDSLGEVVSVSGNTVAVAAAGDDNKYPNYDGSVYVFVREGETWTRQARLAPTDGYGRGFAGSVSLSIDTVMVGARWDDEAGSKSGAVYVFVRRGGTWMQETKLWADHDPYREFGISVSVSGDVALVGQLVGKLVHVFQRDGAAWRDRKKLLASDSEVMDQFGDAVAISGDTAVVGNYRDDDNGNNSGSAYVFSLPCTNARIYCTAQINSRRCLPAIRASGTPSLTVASPFELIATSVLNGRTGFFLYGQEGPNDQPFGGGTLCVLPPIRRTPPQDSGGHVGPDDCSGVLRFDFNAWLREGNDPAVEAGTTIYGQYWYRDPLDPHGMGSTNAVEFEVLP